jgi:hypothetical protein
VESWIKLEVLKDTKVIFFLVYTKFRPVRDQLARAISEHQYGPAVVYRNEWAAALLEEDVFPMGLRPLREQVD